MSARISIFCTQQDSSTYELTVAVAAGTILASALARPRSKLGWESECKVTPLAEEILITENFCGKESFLLRCGPW